MKKYAGAFPLWFAPEQVRVLSVTEKAEGAVKEILAELKNLNIRAKLDIRNEKISKKDS